MLFNWQRPLSHYIVIVDSRQITNYRQCVRTVNVSIVTYTNGNIFVSSGWKSIQRQDVSCDSSKIEVSLLRVKSVK